jgi:hypothetical protein
MIWSLLAKLASSSLSRMHY